MATKLERNIERELTSPNATDHRGTPLVVKITKDGIVLKVKGQRWTSGALLPWGSAYTIACMKKAEQEKLEKKRARQQK